MAAIDFPTTPTNGQQYTNPATGIVYTYSNTYSAWQATANSTVGFTGSKGDIGYTGSVGYVGSLGYTGSKGAGFAWQTESRANVTSSFTSPLDWNSNNYDFYGATGLLNSLTISADAGTPADGQKAIFRFRDNGTARTLNFTTGVSKGFRAVGAFIPTTTIANKIIYVGCVYNASDARWDVIATSQEA